MYIRMYVCIYVCIYSIYIHIHICITKWNYTVGNCFGKTDKNINTACAKYSPLKYTSVQI